MSTDVPNCMVCGEPCHEAQTRRSAIMSDLVSGLLDKLDQIEKQAQDCIDEVGTHRAGDEYGDGSGTADRDAFPSYPWGSEARELAFMTGSGHPAAVLRLCRAHRRIIEEYQRNYAHVEHAETLGNWERGHRVALLCVIEYLARGLGVSTEEDNE